MSEQFDRADYSFVVKRRGNPQKPWRWEIYCAGKSAPVERSPVLFESMAEAAKEGKKALGHFLSERAPEIVTLRALAPGAGSTDKADIATRVRFRG